MTETESLYLKERESDGAKLYYKDPEMKILHRINGPAVEYPNGFQSWYKDGRNHRENGPAITHADGTKEYRLHGILTRENGPAIEYPYGLNYWYYKGLLHREDGPAIECGNHKEWYLKGKRHRLDGPAIEREDGYKAWFIDNEEYLPGYDKVTFIKGEIFIKK